MRLEGKGIDSDGRLIQLTSDAEEIPFALFALLNDDNAVHFINATLSKEIQLALDHASVNLMFPDIQPLESILNERGVQWKTGHYKTFQFPKRYQQFQSGEVKIFSNNDPKVKFFDPNTIAESVYGIEKGEKIVSACSSSRQDNASAEAWVFTSLEFRQRGLGQVVVAAWAAGMMNAGIVPFYSYEISNLASARLASKLGLIPLFEEISIGPA